MMDVHLIAKRKLYSKILLKISFEKSLKKLMGSKIATGKKDRSSIGSMMM
jgi:hypothetical protein